MDGWIRPTGLIFASFEKCEAVFQNDGKHLPYIKHNASSSTAIPLQVPIALALSGISNQELLYAAHGQYNFGV